MGLLALFNRFKKLFKPFEIDDTKYRNFVDNIIPSLKFGDVICAERFNNDLEMEDMGDGHTTGPFVVISFDNDKIIGAYCTTSASRYNSFLLGENYNLFQRQTYVDVYRLKTIDADAYLYKSEHKLRTSDMNRIKKKLTLMHKTITYDDFGLTKEFNEKFDVTYDIGDVVAYNGQTHIIVGKKENDVFQLIPIANYDSKRSYIDFSKVTLDYSNIKENTSPHFHYLNTIATPHLKIILNKYKEYLTRKKEIISNQDKALDRGCLIFAFGGLYYVYGINGNIANAFAVKKTLLVDDMITVGGKKFLPIFDNARDINIKTDKYKILGVASESEMDQIKDAKKSYKKTIKDIKEKSNGKRHKYNFLVSLKDNITIRYIICGEDDNNYSVISVSGLLLGHDILVYTIPKSEVVKAFYITNDELRTVKKRLQESSSNKSSSNALKRIMGNSRN